MTWRRARPSAILRPKSMHRDAVDHGERARARCARSRRSRRPAARTRPDRLDELVAPPRSVRPPAISSSSSTRGPVASARASSRRLRSSRVSAPASVLALRSRPVGSSASTAAALGAPGARPAAEGRADQHVLEDGQPRRRGAGSGRCSAMPSRQRACGGTRVTSRSVEDDARRASGRGRRRSEVEQRRLARAVRPDDAERLAPADRERQLVDDAERRRTPSRRPAARAAPSGLSPA